MVEAHRWAWKPGRVRLVLLAESHVFTTPAELASDYAGHPWLHGLPPVPTCLVRLIYCLGYGESTLCRVAKQGTPQFWGIFGGLAGTTPRHLRGAPRRQRFDEKVLTLRRLKHLGAWLLDSSLHGIYAPRGQRMDGTITAKLQKLWLDSYGGLLLEELRPERVVAIGKGVFSALQGCLKIDDWVYQPQGVRSVRQAAYNRDKLSSLKEWLCRP